MMQKVVLTLEIDVDPIDKETKEYIVDSLSAAATDIGAESYTIEFRTTDVSFTITKKVE